MVSATPITTTDHERATTIATTPQDIIENHILTLLDYLSLTSLSRTSSYFHFLCSQDTIWRDICKSTWPSIDHPRVLQLISAFPNGHRSFFLDSFPLIIINNQPKIVIPKHLSVPSELISAVDVWYQNRPILSRVLETETLSGWFKYSPFRVDLLSQKQVHPTPIKILDWDEDTWRNELQNNLTLSWIIINPTQKRAANFSSLSPVSVQWHWLTGEVQVEYTTVLSGFRGAHVECKVVITCCGKQEGVLHVREVYMQVEDLDGNCLNGKDSLVTLVRGIEFGQRKSGDKEEGQKRHKAFLEMVKKRRDRKMLIARMLDVVCVAGISFFLTFASLYLIGRSW